MPRLRFVPLRAGTAAARSALGAATGQRSHAATSYEDLSLFSSVLRIVRENYVEEVDASRLIRGAVRGMLAELDPHSSYLDPEAHQEMQIDTRGEFHGLGIEISKRRDGVIEVVSPIEGTPAWKAGIRPQDQIVTICPTERPADWKEPCHSTKNMDLHEAVALMRGRRAPPSRSRSSARASRSRSPSRSGRTWEGCVRGGRCSSPVRYVRLRSFRRHGGGPARERRSRRSRMASRSRACADLRDNTRAGARPGGARADEWLADGDRLHEGARRGAAPGVPRRDDREASYPIVVLVNEGGASASEIVGGRAARPAPRAGLGPPPSARAPCRTSTLQEGSACASTPPLYYTPSGRSIQEVGIAPDIEFAPPPRRRRGGSRGQSGGVREQDLEGTSRRRSGRQEGGGHGESTREAGRAARACARVAEELELLRPSAPRRVPRQTAEASSAGGALARWPRPARGGAGQRRPFGCRSWPAACASCLEEEVGGSSWWVRSATAARAVRALLFTLKDDRHRSAPRCFVALACVCPSIPRRALRRGGGRGHALRGAGRPAADRASEEPRGQGALQLRLRALRARLERGLVRPGPQARAPAWPRRVGVVTSPSGAAVRDVIR